jgi:PAS domain S-box-containing protein
MNTADLKKTVLLVEDEAIISMVISEVLKRSGYNVISSGSGEKAVKLAIENDLIDLVLMDIELGSGIDGTEAAREILKIRDLPVVFHTSHDEQDMVEKVRGITRYGYVLKSSGNFVLLSSIEMALELFDAKQKIKEAKERYKFAIEGSNDGIWDVDMLNNVTCLSPRGCEILGYVPDELDIINRVWSDIVHPDDLPMTASALKSYLEGKTPLFQIEQRLKTKSGGWKWILTRGKLISTRANGLPLKMSGTHTDITERKLIEHQLQIKNEELVAINEELNSALEEMQATNEQLIENESALAESEERYHHIFSNHHAVMLIIDPVTEKIVAANNSASAFYGYSTEQLLSMTINDINTLSPEEIKSQLDLAAADKRTYFVFPHRLCNGDIRTVEVYASPIRVKNQNLVFSIIHDITDRL